MPKKCLQCSETAPDACQKDLCGRCCEPPCKPNVHKRPRRVVRGSSGKQARLRTVESWKAANKRFPLECQNVRCNQLSSALGMTMRQLRRAFLYDLIEEARARQDLLRGSPAENSAIDENEALAAALLAPVQRRVGLIDDLIESHEPAGFFPTSDFGPGSDFSRLGCQLWVRCRGMRPRSQRKSRGSRITRAKQRRRDCKQDGAGSVIHKSLHGMGRGATWTCHGIKPLQVWEGCCG